LHPQEGLTQVGKLGLQMLPHLLLHPAIDITAIAKIELKISFFIETPF